MKSKFLIIIAVFLILLPWLPGFSAGINNEVMVDGITISAISVMSITLVFSLISWSLFSWASKNISPSGVILGIISGASLAIPFLQVLGPMAGVIVGVVAGFVAFMLQKKMINPAKNRPVWIAAITLASAYFVLTTIVLVSSSSSTWDTSNGMGAWSGTVDELEEPRFESVFNNIGFVFFLAIIPSLILTELILRGNNDS